MEGPAPLSGEDLLAARTSLSHVVVHLLRAILGFASAYIAATFVIGYISDTTFGRRQWLIEVPIHVTFAGIALTLTSALPIVKDLLVVKQLVTTNERELAAASEGQRFLRDVSDAFEMVEDEDELSVVAGLALEKVTPGDVGGSEILVADSSGAHVSRDVVAGDGTAPGCGLTTPGSCPAVRRGRTLRFADPNGLASCPHLRNRRVSPGVAATCVPVTIMGRPSAVLHATYEFITDQSKYEERVATLEGVAVQYGARLGMLRAMSQSQIQADTDPLTGLLNRRAMENRVREFRSEGRAFALAMMDLDSFKALNDTFGHDTGDRALRLFSRVLSETVRDGDVVCRHGGEEFVVVLPGSDVVTAAPVFHRLREGLAQAVGGSDVPPFTVSVGLCDSSWAEDLQVLLKAADRALMVAKAEGRDCLVIDDPTGASSSPAVSGDEQTAQSVAVDDEPVVSL